jgi:polyphosphate kinase 2
MKHDEYHAQLEALQLALVHTQQAAMASGDMIVVVMEGRDSAGKDGAIKRVTEHLSTRATRVVALPKPSSREEHQWWFQRYVAHLPAPGELVIFNRSWYNRGGVERVMGFSSPEDQELFLRHAPVFEQLLVESGIKLIKYWLDITKDEQAKRLEARRDEPLKALKVSDMDDVAHAKWNAYSAARDEMLTRTHTAYAPWTCVQADDKRPARLAVMAHLVRTVAPAKIAKTVEEPKKKLLFPFELDAITDGRLAR